MFCNIFKYVFDPISVTGEEPINFSIIEALLFDIFHLAKSCSITISNLVGKGFVYTGQPGELDGFVPDDEKYQAFRTKIESIQGFCESYRSKVEDALKNAKESTIFSPEEKKEKIRKTLDARKNSGNVLKLCRILLKDQPMGEREPEHPSWKFVKKSNKTRRNDKQRKPRRNNH